MQQSPLVHTLPRPSLTFYCSVAPIRPAKYIPSHPNTIPSIFSHVFSHLNYTPIFHDQQFQTPFHNQDSQGFPQLVVGIEMYCKKLPLLRPYLHTRFLIFPITLSPHLHQLHKYFCIKDIDKIPCYQSSLASKAPFYPLFTVYVGIMGSERPYHYVRSLNGQQRNTKNNISFLSVESLANQCHTPHSLLTNQ